MHGARKQNGKVAILCDFDGTITVEEVSTSLLDRYSGRRWRRADADLLAGRISLRQTMAREFKLLRAPRSEMERFVEGIHLREGAAELVAAARRHRSPLLIVSEGLDFYIAAFLRQRNLRVGFRSNHAVFTPDGVSVEHPFADGGCDLCGTCKKAQLRELGSKGYTTVYIGDGISDRCPARFCDVLFARGGLLEYCRSAGIGCIPYGDFHDVLRALEAMFWKRAPAARVRPPRRSGPSRDRRRPPLPGPMPRRR